MNNARRIELRGGLRLRRGKVAMTQLRTRKTGPSVFFLPFYSMRRLKRDALLLEQKLALMREIDALCNSRLGLDCTVNAVLEKLRVFYGATSCLLVCADGSGNHCLRRVTDLASGARKLPLVRELARLFLELPSTCAILHDTRNHAQEALLLCYETTALEQVAFTMPLDARLSGLMEDRPFVSVPLLHQQQSLGRLFLTGDESTFDPSQIPFLSQAMGHLVLLLKNMEIIDKLARDAAEDERLRIARDIHDSIVQPHIGLQMGIESLRRRVETGSDLLPDIERLSELCHAGTLELRCYVEQLKESREREESLLVSLRRLTTKWELVSGISVHLDCDSKLQLPPRLAAEVLHLVTEALSNVRRHTQAEHVSIALSCQTGFFVLRIENCGTIAPPASDARLERSFTPKSLSERTWSLGGHIEVEAHPSSATVRIQIPF